jgi:hypothetical protein
MVAVKIFAVRNVAVKKNIAVTEMFAVKYLQSDICS